MGGLLILISVVTGTVAFISLIRPLPRFWLPTRKRAAIAWVASFVLLFIGAALSPNPKPEELAMQEQGTMERVGAERGRGQEQARQPEAENFLSNGVGKKVPYELWVNGIFGAPDTLVGTDGRYWVAHLAEIDVSFVSEKSSEEVLYVGHGKSAQDYLEKKAAARKERIEKGFSSLWDGSHRELTKVIKGSMNDPGSYEHVKTVYWDMGDHLVVRTTFRGKNAFGGVVSNWVKAKTDLDGNVLEVIEQGR